MFPTLSFHPSATRCNVSGMHAHGHAERGCNNLPPFNYNIKLTKRDLFDNLVFTRSIRLHLQAAIYP